jgi:hypothetical protein
MENTMIIHGAMNSDRALAVIHKVAMRHIILLKSAFEFSNLATRELQVLVAHLITKNHSLSGN